MTYEELVENIAEVSGHPIETIKDIIWAIPDILTDMKEGERTYTPMGIFHMLRTKKKTVMMPDQSREVPIKPKLLVKLRANDRMKRFI